MLKTGLQRFSINLLKKIVIIRAITAFVCFGQQSILPGDISINRSKLIPGNKSMSYSINYKGKWVQIGTYFTHLEIDNSYLKVSNHLDFLNSSVKWENNFVSDATSLKPLSSYSSKDESIISVTFSKTVTVNHTNKKTQKNETKSLYFKGDYFDASIYPYLLQMLPLKIGYKAVIPVFDYEAQDNSKLHLIEVREVVSDLYISDVSGAQNVWRVTVFEGNTGHTFKYFIDKSKNRIWKIDITSVKGDKILMTDIEDHATMFQNKFDKKETFAMINEGTSAISGIAFARDNKTEGLLSGMAIFNINKKQYAAKGTNVVLIPYTPYFKEWIKLNEKQSKIKYAKAIPLSKDAYECFKTTSVYDDRGHFEFANLKAGEYLIITAFGYTHTSSRTEETGRSAVFVNGTYQGDNVYTSIFSYNSNATANIQKVVKIKDNGSKLKVKLKKTL